MTPLQKQRLPSVKQANSLLARSFPLPQNGYDKHIFDLFVLKSRNFLFASHRNADNFVMNPFSNNLYIQ